MELEQHVQGPRPTFALASAWEVRYVETSGIAYVMYPILWIEDTAAREFTRAMTTSIRLFRHP